MNSDRNILDNEQLQMDNFPTGEDDIRRPLDYIVEMADKALAENIDDVVREYLNQIKESAKCILDGLNDDYFYSLHESGSRIISVEYKPLNLFDDIIHTVNGILSGKDIEVIGDIENNIPTSLYGDEKRIKEIVLILCENAIKYTNEGHIKIHADFEWADYETVYLCISVEDTGIGMKEDVLAKTQSIISKSQFKGNRDLSAKEKNLLTCSELLRIMGSTLEMESEFGVGSSFSFKIKQRVVDPLPSVLDNIL